MDDNKEILNQNAEAAETAAEQAQSEVFENAENAAENIAEATSEAENAARSKPRRVTTLRPSVMWGLKGRESILKPAARRSFESLSAI